MNKKFELKKMKVVILAGGFGTRLSEYTKDIPKPPVSCKSMIFHIMSCYAKYGLKIFILLFAIKENYKEVF